MKLFIQLFILLNSIYETDENYFPNNKSKFIKGNNCLKAANHISYLPWFSLG